MEREIIPQHLIPDPNSTVKSEVSLRLCSEEFWLRVLGASGVVSYFYPFPLLVHVSWLLYRRHMLSKKKYFLGWTFFWSYLYSWPHSKHISHIKLFFKRALFRCYDYYYPHFQMGKKRHRESQWLAQATQLVSRRARIMKQVVWLAWWVLAWWKGWKWEVNMAMRTTVCQEKDKDERTSQEVSLKTLWLCSITIQRLLTMRKHDGKEGIEKRQ